MTIELVTGDILDWAPTQPADRFDLVFGSPPYCDARTYGIDAQRGCVEWVHWMLDVSIRCARFCRGPILWVVAGVTRHRNYWPAPEGLAWEWWRRGGVHQLYRPCAYHRVGIPGSGGKDWFRSDWEYVLCLKRPGVLPWADNTACGWPPRWAPGGAISHRLTSGERRASGKRQKGGRSSHRVHTMRRAAGHMENQGYAPPKKANPGNVLVAATILEEVNRLLDVRGPGDIRSGKVGGGRLGHPLAHDNEAPFPEWLAEVFVRSFCPPGGWVLDPFSGSGTTTAVCQRLGRNAVGLDVRESQTELAARRLTDPKYQEVPTDA